MRMRRVAGACLGLLVVGGLGAQERLFPVPANVTIDGVPPIPLSLVQAVAPYGQFRQAILRAWHPTEREIIITTSFGAVPQLHRVKTPGGARTQITFYSDGVATRPGTVFGPDGQSFVFQKDTAGGGEADQLFRYDLARGRTVMLTDGKSRNGGPAISRTGLIAYDSTERDGKNRDLYVMDPASPASRRVLVQREGRWSAVDWSADGKTVLALQFLSSSETFLWTVRADTGEKTLITPKEATPVAWALPTTQGPREQWATAAVAPDGRTIYALSNRGGETTRVWRFNGSGWAPVTAVDQPVETFALKPDGKTLAVVFDAGVTSRLQLMDVNGRAIRTPAVPPGVISELQWHPVRAEVGFTLAGGRAFNDVYSVDLTRGRVERWTFSEMGGANPETLPDAEIVKWKSFDGLEISGVLYRPPASFAGPRPVIINVHGGPVDRERPRALGRSNYFRNELGIAIIYPNIRGSSGFGRSFEDLDNGLLRENAVRDIGALLDWIAAQPGLDKNRVMIAGPSYGGFVALAAGAAYADRLRGVNPAFAITDLPGFLETTEMSRQGSRNAEYGDPSNPEVRAFLTRISPLTNAKKLNMPVFIAAGARDTRVPIALAEALVKALKANRTPVWYVRFEEAGHQQLTVPTNDFSIYTWVMFVQKYLLN
jgi:dipeptidyl aminopeptidase/acylaminoacyl peptidase